ncbi:hypothetical protein AGIG_G14487 [Arapaima gigas]
MVVDIAGGVLVFSTDVDGLVMLAMDVAGGVVVMFSNDDLGSFTMVIDVAGGKVGFSTGGSVVVVMDVEEKQPVPYKQEGLTLQLKSRPGQQSTGVPKHPPEKAPSRQAGPSFHTAPPLLYGQIKLKIWLDLGRHEQRQRSSSGA